AGTAALARRRRGQSPRGRRGCAPYPSHVAFCRRRALDREHQAVSVAAGHCMLQCAHTEADARRHAQETTVMTIDVATGISRIVKDEGVGWVSTSPVCRVNNALGREGVPMLMMRDDRYAVAVADAFSRITGGSRIGVATFQGGVNAAGMQYAYAGLAQAYEDGSPVLCITDGVPAGSSG